MIDSPVIDRAALIVRGMETRDLAQVLMVERNVHISPWSRLSFEESLTENEKYTCCVIELHNDIVGYFVVCPVADELHILNIAISSQYQGLGISHLLMQDIIRTAAENKTPKIFLEVRASNHIAQSLYLKWQFEQIAIRKRYYSLPNSTNTNDREDAFVFLRYMKT